MLSKIVVLVRNISTKIKNKLWSIKAPGLVNAHILISCSDEKHKSCYKLKHALLEKTNDIHVAYNVKPTMGSSSDRYCIAATAKIDPKKRGLFEEYLQKFKALGGTLKVKTVRIDLEQK